MAAARLLRVLRVQEKRQTERRSGQTVVGTVMLGNNRLGLGQECMPDMDMDMDIN